MISGHALSAERNKISKSKSHKEAGPMEIIEQESSDALRYWATSVKTGNDTTFNTETIANGRRLVTKLWNASRFAEARLASLVNKDETPEALLPTDRWLLSRLARTVAFATAELERTEYSTARAEVEHFFWSDLCDNYLELAKARLYRESGPEHEAAQWTLYHTLLTTIELLAPYLPYVTEKIYQELFRVKEGVISLHRMTWPDIRAEWLNEDAEETGNFILEVLKHVRRYKAEQGMSVGAEIDMWHIDMQHNTYQQRANIKASLIDLKSATRARDIVILTV
jgi:valyl-tRNA synthetase